MKLPRLVLACGIAFALALGLTASGDAQGPVVLRTSAGVEAGTSASPLRVDPTGSTTQPVSAASLPLPSGAATGAKQDTGNTSLASIDGKITAVNTGAVVVSSSALPAGASTAAKQPALGTAGSASSDVLSVQGIASMTPLQISQATAANLNATVVGTGTFAVQAAQSGTWTVQPGNTANTTAWKVDGSAVTQPVSISGNQAVNVAQINGVTPLMGAGNTGTGSHRVTIATDQAALAGMGVAATGAAPPANAVYNGGIGSGATGGFLQPVTVCDTQAFLDMTTATTTELVALTSGRKIYVCYWLAESNGTTVMTFKRGTGTNCGTGTTSISPAWDLTAQTGFSGGSGVGAIFDNQTAANALCVTNSSAVNLHVFVRYAVY